MLFSLNFVKFMGKAIFVRCLQPINKRYFTAFLYLIAGILLLLSTTINRGAMIHQKAYCDILRYGKPVLRYILRYTWYLYFCL